MRLLFLHFLGERMRMKKQQQQRRQQSANQPPHWVFDARSSLNYVLQLFYFVKFSILFVYSCSNITLQIDFSEINVALCVPVHSLCTSVLVIIFMIFINAFLRLFSPSRGERPLFVFLLYLVMHLAHAIATNIINNNIQKKIAPTFIWPSIMVCLWLFISYFHFKCQYLTYIYAENTRYSKLRCIFMFFCMFYSLLFNASLLNFYECFNILDNTYSKY